MMDTSTSKPARVSQWLGIVIFAIAMAWMESAVVLYLRSMSQEFDPYKPMGLPLPAHILRAEMVREAATLVMLACAGWLAGRTWRTRAALAIVAFGTWDIFYYIFLVPLTGWPRSVWEVKIPPGGDISTGPVFS